MLDRVRRRAWGLSGRLIASYILVTVAVVVLVEALVLCFLVPRLVNGVKLQSEMQAQVDATAKSYGQQIAERYPRGVPAGTELGDPSVPAKLVQANSDGTLAVPAISGPFNNGAAVTAVVVTSPGGTVVASSVPSRYPAGQPAASEVPPQAATVMASPHMIKRGSVPTPWGNVLFTVWQVSRSGVNQPPASAPGLIAYVYVQVPWSPPGFVSPVSAWGQLKQLGDTGLVLLAPAALLFAIVPVGVLFGLLTSWRLVRRVRRLEGATLAVADGDYSVALPVSGRDEIGRLEANFTTMTRQLGSALTAERERAAGDARAAERARIAREVHDAISQHLFALRMIAAGMRRADADNPQAQVIERISSDALREMQALLIELRPVCLDGAGLGPALQEICAAYRDRLGVIVDANLDDVTVPAPVEHALLRITQEACANAVRHGGARQLAVSMTRQDGHVELAVRDAGAGFDPAAPHAGSGLAHIRDRVAELGGTVDVDSAPGRGAALTVRVPVP